MSRTNVAPLASRAVARLVYETIQFSPYLGGPADLAAQFRAAAAAGFDGVGIDVWSLACHRLEDVVTELERCGLPCTELQAVTLHGDTTDEMRPSSFLELLDAFQPEIVMASAAPQPDDETAAEISATVDALTARGARVAVEFLPMLPLDTIAKTRDVVRRAGGPARHIGVCVDTWHFFRGPDGWDDLDALPVDELAYVQFNDAPPVASDDLWHETLHRRTAPGDGEFELDRFCDIVRAKGYDGPVAVEVMSESLRAAGPEEYARCVIAGARRYWS